MPNRIISEKIVQKEPEFQKSSQVNPISGGQEDIYFCLLKIWGLKNHQIFIPLGGNIKYPPNPPPSCVIFLQLFKSPAGTYTCMTPRQPELRNRDPSLRKRQLDAMYARRIHGFGRHFFYTGKLYNRFYTASFRIGHS